MGPKEQELEEQERQRLARKGKGWRLKGHASHGQSGGASGEGIEGAQTKSAGFDTWLRDLEGGRVMPGDPAPGGGGV